MATLRQLERREKVRDVAKATTAAKKTAKAKKNARFEGFAKWPGGYVKQEYVKQGKSGGQHVVTVKSGKTQEEAYLNSKKEADDLFQAAIAAEKGKRK